MSTQVWWEVWPNVQKVWEALSFGQFPTMERRGAREEMLGGGEGRRAVIVSVGEFYPLVNLQRRPGATRDAKKLHKTLSKMGFKVDIHIDPSSDEIYELFFQGREQESIPACSSCWNQSVWCQQLNSFILNVLNEPSCLWNVSAEKEFCRLVSKLPWHLIKPGMVKPDIQELKWWIDQSKMQYLEGCWWTIIVLMSVEIISKTQFQAFMPWTKPTNAFFYKHHNIFLNL